MVGLTLLLAGGVVGILSIGFAWYLTVPQWQAIAGIAASLVFVGIILLDLQEQANKR